MDTPHSPALRTPAGPASRPRLHGGRSAVRRAPDAVQFGTDPRRALVLDGLTPPLRRMVTALDGTRCTGEIIADAVARGVSPAPARAVLDHLTAAGLLDGPAVGTTVSGSVLVRGRGRLAVALCAVLTGAGLEVGLAGSGVVEAADTGTGLTGTDVGLPFADAVAGAIRGVRPGPGARPDLVVATGAAVEPALADELRRRGRPHVAVTARDGVGYVGPLVLPGRGPCLRCAELARADADPAWPAVLAQLVGAPPPVRVAEATATAALGAAQILAALAGPARVVELAGPTGLTAVGAVLELDLERGTLHRATVATHSACLCGAAPPAARRSTTGRQAFDPGRPVRSTIVARVA